MQYPITILALTAVTAYVTYRCLHDQSLFDKLAFKPRSILAYKEYYRLISSCFVHVDWMHFAFNFITLYSFGGMLELSCGIPVLLAIYFSAVIGGDLLSLWMHRNHEYTAVGASGGVCGILFASIFLFDSSVGLFFLPIYVPGWLYAIIYMGVSYYALRGNRGNIGHDAHLGGAIVGLLVALAIYPAVFLAKPVLLTLVLGISTTILYLLFKDPLWIKEPAILLKKSEYRPNVRYQRYDEPGGKKQKEAEVNRLLEKISQKGFASLSEEEKDRLKDYSKQT